MWPRALVDAVHHAVGEPFGFVDAVGVVRGYELSVLGFDSVDDVGDGLVECGFDLVHLHDGHQRTSSICTVISSWKAFTRSLICFMSEIISVIWLGLALPDALSTLVIWLMFVPIFPI